MGGCVVSLMSFANERRQCRHEAHAKSLLTPSSVALPRGSASPKESAVYRSFETKDMSAAEVRAELYGGKYGQLPRLLKEKAARFATKRAMAYRPIDRVEKTEIEEGGKKRPWEFIHLKPTEDITFQDMWSMMVAFGHGLASLGFGKGDRMAIYEETRYEWLVSLYGLWSQGMTGVTVYANLGEDALVYALKEAEVPVMVMNGKMVKKTIKLCKANGIKCPKLITTDDVPAGDDVGDAHVISFHDVVKAGRGLPEPPLASDPEETALVMYTSGTTGDPKGVVMTHGNIYSAVIALNTRLSVVIGNGENQTYIGYLPLAHIMEFAAENLMLFRGDTVCYGNPRTLTDTSAKPHGDLKEFKPVYLAGVPRVYDTIKKAVEAKLPPYGSLKRRIFEQAYEERRDALAKGLETPYWNEKVFTAPAELLGGRCVALVSGGGPLSAATQEFLEVVFALSVHQGYGLTETCASCTVQRFYSGAKENVGGLLDCTEVKLRDVEHWKHTDPEPRGEILIRGPAVAKGYYKQPEKTKEAFLEDGFFCTGDVGQITKDGTLKIVGRVKALAKNALGEYIAMEQLETIYVLDDLALPNGICVLVHPHKAYIAALVLTDEKKALAFAEKNGIAGGYPEVLADKVFQQKAAASLAATAKAQGRKPFECVKYVRVLADEWTPENGVLTAAMKLKRRVIDEKYADTIQALFAA